MACGGGGDGTRVPGGAVGVFKEGGTGISACGPGSGERRGRGRVAAADSGRGTRARRQAGKERESGSAREVDRARGPRSGLWSCSHEETGERARVAGRPKGEGAAVWAEGLVSGCWAGLRWFGPLSWMAYGFRLSCRFGFSNLFPFFFSISNTT